MAREGSKRQVAIEVISMMVNDPADEVVQAIMVANDLSHSAARAYFTYLTKEGFVKHEGAPLVSKRGRPKVEKTAKPVKAKKEKVKPVVQASDEPATSTGEFTEQAKDFIAWREKKAQADALADESEQAPVVEDVDSAFGDEVQGVPEWMPDSLRSSVAAGALAD